MSRIRICPTRAPGLLPSLVHEIRRASHPVVLIPESFTLACEMEIVRASGEQGIFDLNIFSPSSLVREVQELTGTGQKRPVSGDGQNMMISRILHRCRKQLKFYGDAVAQPKLAAKIAGQLDDFTRALLTPEFLKTWRPASQRTQNKLDDLILIWEAYREALDRGFEDTVGQWISAMQMIRKSGILRDSQLLIYGFDYITHDLMSLVKTAAGQEGAREVVIGIISDDVGPDRDIFKSANDSLLALKDMLERLGMEYSVQRETVFPPIDAGIAYVEKALYALGPFARTRQGAVLDIREDAAAVSRAAMTELEQVYVPDLSHVHLYYAKNASLECQHACQTLIQWRREGVAWEEMAVAVCDQGTLSSLLPLTLAEAGIPFNAKQDQPMLMSACAQYFLSLLRILRLNFPQRDVLRMMKTGFTPLRGDRVMEMENYAREHGIHRDRWLIPFRIPEKERDQARVQELEALRARLIDPMLALREALSREGCTGIQAATLLYRFLIEQGVYTRLVEEQERLAEGADDLAIDRNRQVWTAINELLDTVATFFGEEPVPRSDLCAMLEACLSARTIKSLPQLSRAVMVAPPQMFFSSGIRRMIVMGVQEDEISPVSKALSEQELHQLERHIETVTIPEAPRPYSRIGQSLMDLAARQKQDVYQAVSLAREELVLSCSGAKPGGGVLTPSTAFRRLANTLRKTNPENVAGGLFSKDLKPFAPSFALEALALRLREARGGGDEFLRGEKRDDRLWKDALGALYRSEAWRPRVEEMLKGLHVQAPSARLSPETAGRLYLSRGMSISRVETFAACPYRHLMQYGLDLFPAGSWVFRPNEQGTFNHDVLELFLKRAMSLKEWPELSERTQTRLLNQILRERVKAWEGGILTSDTLHRYQGAGIIRGIRTSIASLMRSFRQKPHFLPLGVEVPFGTPDENGVTRIPAIRIQTEDGETIAFSGRMDRIDLLTAADGTKYSMITDNKMSAKEVRLNSIAEGLQLQLPLYILAARNGLEDCEAAGGVYQPILDPLVEEDTPDQIHAKIDKELQTAGIVLEREEIRSAMKPYKISRKLESNDTVSTVSPQELEEIQRLALDVTTGLVNRIRRGEADPRPVRDGKESPCAFCDHAESCLFDPTIPGCSVREVGHKRRVEPGSDQSVS